jgi:hypothetical protein
MNSNDSIWCSCSTCKKPIAFQQTYYVCSVSTCNRKRNGFFFCSVACWDAHVPIMRHRESWAEQHTAPSRAAWEREQQAEQVPKAARTPAVSSSPAGSSQEVLIVVSKLKQYIKQQAGMNTSDVVSGVLSAHLRHLCDQAIAHAAEEGRKTVMERDFEPFLDVQ